MKVITTALIIVAFTATTLAKKNDKLTYNKVNFGNSNSGSTLTITFDEGAAYNHPLFAIWLANAEGKYIQTLYVSQSIGKGEFLRGKIDNGSWQPGEIQRPAALPYWTFQRNIKNERGTLLPTPQKPVADAYTGATPKNSFILSAKCDQKLSGKYIVYFEINQSWDWNEYWYNDKYPNDADYKTSSQPALVYFAEIDSSNPGKTITFELVGHSHYSGKDGNLSFNLNTITTAKKIAKKITIKLEE